MAHWKKRETIFREYGLTLALSGHWQQRDLEDSNRWFYRSPDRREQLTITRLDDYVIDHGEASHVISKASLRNRRAVELAFGRVSDVELTPMETGEFNGVPASWFEGYVPSARQGFHSLLLFDTRMAWALYHETFKLSEEEAQAQARAIWDTVAIND